MLCIVCNVKNYKHIQCHTLNENDEHNQQRTTVVDSDDDNNDETSRWEDDAKTQNDVLCCIFYECRSANNLHNCKPHHAQMGKTLLKNRKTESIGQHEIWRATTTTKNEEAKESTLRDRERGRDRAFVCKGKGINCSLWYDRDLKKMKPQIINEYEKKNWIELKSCACALCIVYFGRCCCCCCCLFTVDIVHKFVCFIWRQQSKAVYRNFWKICLMYHIKL